jgi:fructose transport system substrate-binding protein
MRRSTTSPREGTIRLLFGLFAVSAFALALGVQGVCAADKPIVGLTNTNPFFVKMKAGAEEAAKASGLELRSFAGKVDGDNDGQVAAVENLIASGAKGIVITPNDSRAIVPAIAKARAAGILVIALDTPLDPPIGADVTFATDNFRADGAPQIHALAIDWHDHFIEMPPVVRFGAHQAVVGR